jgi:Bacterial pre-peptidase C-terminal domain
MQLPWRTFLPLLAVCAALLPRAGAQQNPPHLGYIYPAGGRQGDTLQVKVGGQYFDGITNVFFSAPGLSATLAEYVKPMSAQQAKELKDRSDALRQMPRDSATVAELAAIRAKLDTFIRRPANPALIESATLRVSLPTNVPPGSYELRLATPNGLSNPLTFCVGQLPEISKPAAGSPGTPNEKQLQQNEDAQSAVPPVDTSVTLPAVLNGQILPGGVDRYHFHATQGRQLVVAVSARALIPYLADAVPGWFQAALTIYDPAGKPLAYDDNFRFHPDPVLHCVIPRDGDYVIEVRDSIYRGREDFVYRITAGELPYVTGIYPLGGKAGTRTTIEVQGWNLPRKSLVMDATAKKPGVYPVSLETADWVSNPLPFAVDDLPECREQEPNDSRETAQPVALPILINGRIDHPGDHDWFRFTGKAGDPFVAEVLARRLDSPLDSVLKLFDAAGKQLAMNDDHEDKGAGLDTHYADSYIACTLPADGDYFVQLGDVQHKGGPEYSYRLRLGPPRPDFSLRVTPSSVNARGGTSVPLTVYALRKDGFTNAITLVLADAPYGFKLNGGGIPAGQDQVRVTLTVPATPSSTPFHPVIEGVSAIGDKPVLREAVPAEDMMQAFAYRHLVPAREMDVLVLQRRAGRAPLKIVSATPLKIPAGGSGTVQVGFQAAKMAGQIQFELSNPPEGVSLQGTTTDQAGLEITLQTDAAKIKPGLKGNLIINAYVLRDPPKDKAAKNKNKFRVDLGALPAIPLEILPPQ